MLSIRSSAALVLLACAANAQIIIPASISASTEGSSSSAYPWGANATQVRVQYCYDTTNFTANSTPVSFPIMITGFRWRANAVATSTSWAGGTYSHTVIRVGPAANEWNAQTNSFDGNWLGGVPSDAHAGPITVTGGSGAGTGVPGPWYVTQALAAPVFYDPTAGADLIVEFQMNGVFAGATTNPDLHGTNANSTRTWTTSSATAATATTVNQLLGLVTEVQFVPAVGIFASFTSDKQLVGPGEQVTFTSGSVTSDPGGILTTDWDFTGDGITDASGSPVQWSFASCGPHDVRLTVTDAVGSASLNRVGWITVGAPVASFTVAGAGAPPVVVSFTDTSTRAPTSWSWDLDGDSVYGDSTVQNPVWGYATEGLFTVGLQATNACGTTTTTRQVDTRRLLSTLFAGGNSGAVQLFFDATVTNPAGITVSGLEVNSTTAAGGTISAVSVYCKPGTHVGSEDTAAAWSLVAAGTTATAAGSGQRTVVNIPDFGLAPGTWGIAIAGGSPSYTNGNGTNQNYSNADLALSLGSGRGALFGGTVFTPRVWNGSIAYSIGVTAGTWTDLGGGCVNSTALPASMSSQGGLTPATNRTITLDVVNAPPSTPIAGILFGFSELAPPTGVDLGLIGGQFGCVVHVNSQLTLPLTIGGGGTGSSPALAIGHNAFGLTFYAQAAMYDPGSPAGLQVVTSNALAGFVGNL